MPIESGRSKNVLFVFAHQDDEYFASTRIAHEIDWGHSVHCAYLTDGTASGTAPELRNRESQRVLERLGVSPKNLLFLGSARSVPDGRLVLHLEDSHAELERALEARPIHRVYCLAYEGGHQDHDASHLIALAFARRRRLLPRTWQISLYNGHRVPWRLFRVDSPLPRTARRLDRRLPARLALEHTLLALYYPSEWRSLLGLFPEHLFKRVFLRRETIQAVTLDVLRERPHRGLLLYERLFGFSYDDFQRASGSFLAKHLPPDETDRP